jgi:hypothetical protein
MRLPTTLLCNRDVTRPPSSVYSVPFHYPPHVVLVESIHQGPCSPTTKPSIASDARSTATDVENKTYDQTFFWTRKLRPETDTTCPRERNRKTRPAAYESASKKQFDPIQHVYQIIRPLDWSGTNTADSVWEGPRGIRCRDGSTHLRGHLGRCKARLDKLRSVHKRIAKAHMADFKARQRQTSYNRLVVLCVRCNASFGRCIERSCWLKRRHKNFLFATSCCRFNVV